MKIKVYKGLTQTIRPVAPAKVQLFRKFWALRVLCLGENTNFGLGMVIDPREKALHEGNRDHGPHKPRKGG